MPWERIFYGVLGTGFLLLSCLAGLVLVVCVWAHMNGSPDMNDGSEYFLIPLMWGQCTVAIMFAVDCFRGDVDFVMRVIG